MGTLDLEWRFPSAAGARQGAPRARPRRLLVLGDFGGRASRGLIEGGAALAARPMVRVRQEAFDAAIAAVAPRLVLPRPRDEGPGPDGAAPVGLSISSLEDFHPDALFKRLPFLGAAAAPGATPSSPAATAGVASGTEDDAATISRLLGSRPARPRESTAVESLVGRIVAKHAGPAAPPAPAIDAEAMGRLMRAVLRQPALQELEANWRALEILVSRLDEDVEVFLLDVSKAELAADLVVSTSPADGGGNVADGELGRRLLTPPGGLPFSALVGAFSFDPGANDVAILRQLGTLCARVGAPLIAGASPEVLGCASLAGETDPTRWPGLAADEAKRWSALRQNPDARWLGLALPRFLARAPYGAKTGAIDAFRFEEIDGAPDPSAFVWGNPAFLCALLLTAESHDDLSGEIDDLPFFSFLSRGEPEMYPASEVFWGETAATAVIQRGLMPFISRRDRNAVRLVRLQSIADPATPLGG